MELKTQLQNGLEALANLFLLNEEPLDLTSDDMVNASVIFSSVVWQLAFPNLRKKGMSLEESGQIATEVGKNIRQTVQLATGIDLHEAVEWSEIIE